MTAGKLRVLHIGNGKAFKISAIIDGLRARGHENHMVPIPPGPRGFEGAEWHCPPSSALPGQAKVLHRLLQVRRLARKLRPDIVHAHNAWGPGWYGAATGIHPYVIHAYGSDMLPEQYRGRSALQRHMTGWACRSADRIVVTGAHMIHASQRLGIAREKIALLSRGVDIKSYRPGLDTTALRAELDLSDATPVILSPRYQVDEGLYNLDVIIDAFAELRQQYPAAVALQLFDPTREAGARKLRELADERSLGNAYRLIPAVDNSRMPLLYNLANVAVSVPSSDGFPVSVLEASACGCPLIVGELPYCDEWFESGENGLVVPTGDARALAKALRELCGNPDLRRQFGEAGRKLVAERADYERCMDSLETLYLTLVAERRGLGETR
jgi:glycosyltransferase involved in cell wall biosynthesis